MSEPFKAGEIAIGQNFVDFPEHNGEELLVLSGLHFREGTDLMTLETMRRLVYLVQSTTGEWFSVSPYNLRRRKPPATGEQSVLAMFKGQPQAVPA